MPDGMQRVAPPEPRSEAKSDLDPIERSSEIAGIVFGRDFADVRPLKLPRLPVLTFADIVDVSKWLSAAIKTLDKGETLEARGMILRAEEIVNRAR